VLGTQRWIFVRKAFHRFDLTTRLVWSNEPGGWAWSVLDIWHFCHQKLHMVASEAKLLDKVADDYGSTAGPRNRTVVQERRAVGNDSKVVAVDTGTVVVGTRSDHKAVHKVADIWPERDVEHYTPQIPLNVYWLLLTWVPNKLVLVLVPHRLAVAVAHDKWEQGTSLATPTQPVNRRYYPLVRSIHCQPPVLDVVGV
jgi:hypothetical protein